MASVVRSSRISSRSRRQSRSGRPPQSQSLPHLATATNAAAASPAPAAVPARTGRRPQTALRPASDSERASESQWRAWRPSPTAVRTSSPPSAAAPATVVASPKQPDDDASQRRFAGAREPAILLATRVVHAATASSSQPAPNALSHSLAPPSRDRPTAARRSWQRPASGRDTSLGLPALAGLVRDWTTLPAVSSPVAGLPSVPLPGFEPARSSATTASAGSACTVDGP